VQYTRGLCRGAGARPPSRDKLASRAAEKKGGAIGAQSFRRPLFSKGRVEEMSDEVAIGSVRASHRSLVALDPDVSGLTADTVKAAEFGNVDSSLGRLPTALPLEDELHAL